MGSDGELHDMRVFSLVLCRFPAFRLKHIVPLICGAVTFPYVTVVGSFAMFIAIRLASSRVSSLDAMSALPPKADIAERDDDVRFVPESDIERNCLPNLFQAAA